MTGIGGDLEFFLHNTSEFSFCIILASRGLEILISFFWSSRVILGLLYIFLLFSKA